MVNIKQDELLSCLYRPMQDIRNGIQGALIRFKTDSLLSLTGNISSQ